MQLKHAFVINTQLRKQRQQADAGASLTGPVNVHSSTRLQAAHALWRIVKLDQRLKIHPQRINHPATALGIKPCHFQPATLSLLTHHAGNDDARHWQ